jgi:hypothetical protein
MYRNNKISNGNQSNLKISINKGVELLLRRKPPIKVINFGRWFFPIINKEFTVYLEIKDR